MAGGSIASLFVEIGAKTEGLQSGLRSAGESVSGFASKVGGLAGAAATGFGMALAAPIIGGIGGVFGSVTEGVMGTNAALQQSQVAWGVMLGGADQARAKVQELYDFGANTPFDFGEVDKASMLLQTFGGNALNTNANLTMVGNAASGTGQRFQDVAFWTARLYDNLTNGQPIGEAISNLQQMGVVSGATRNQLEQMQKEGAKGPELWAAYAASQERFNGMMDQQSHTFNGLLSTMKDSLNQLLATAGKPIFDVLSNGLEKVVNLMSSPGFVDGATHFAQMLGNGLAAAGSAIGAFIPKVIGIGQSFFDMIGQMRAGNFQGAFLAIMDMIGKVFGLDSMAPVASFVGQALSFLYNLKDGAVAAFQMIAGFVTGTLIPGIQAFIPVAVAAFQHIGEWIMGTAVPALTQFGTFLIGIWDQALPVIQNFIATVLPQIVTGFQQLVPKLQEFGTFLVNAFNTAVPIIQQFAAGVLPALQSGFQTVSAAVQAIVPYVQSFAATLQTGINNVVPALEHFGQLIGSAIGGALQAIIPLAQQLWATFQSQLPAIIALGGQLRGVWEQVQNALTALAPVGKLVAEVLGGMFVTSVGVLMGVLGGLVGMFSGILPGAIQIVSGSITVIQGVIQTFTAIVTGVVNVVTDLIHGDWSGAWRDAQTMVQGVAAGIETIVSGLWTQIQGLFNAGIGAVSGFVSGFVSTITGYFDGLLTSLTGNTTNISSTIQTGWEILTNAVTSTVSGWVSSIGQKFSDLGTNAQNAVDSLKSGVTSAFNGLTSGVQTAIDNLVSAVVGGLTGLIGTAASNAASIGSAIISGIVGAIQAGAGQIQAAIAGVVGNVIDAAKNILGVHSPSRVFAEIGGFVMQGWANGITNNAGLGVAAITNTLQTALDAGDGMALKVNVGGLSARVGDTSSRSSGNGDNRAITVNLNIAGSVVAQEDLKELAIQAYYEAGRQGRL